MVVTQEDFENMEIRYARVVRTSDSEEYMLFWTTPERRHDPRSSEEPLVGHLSLHFTTDVHSKSLVIGLLVLESEWREDALNNLLEKVERDKGRATAMSGLFVLDVFFSKSHESYQKPGHGSTPFYRMNDIKREFDKIQDMVDRLPESLSETIHAAIDEQYQDIEEIIESDLDEEEKKERLMGKMEVGIERGLPTFIYREK